MTVKSLEPPLSDITLHPRSSSLPPNWFDCGYFLLLPHWSLAPVARTVISAFVSGAEISGENILTGLDRNSDRKFVELMHPTLREWVRVPVDKIVYDALTIPDYFERLTPADDDAIGCKFEEAACCQLPIAVEFVEAVANLPAAKEWVLRMVGILGRRAGYIVWGRSTPTIALAIHPATNKWVAVDLADPAGLEGLFDPVAWPMSTAERAAVGAIAADPKKAARRSRIEIAAHVIGPRRLGQIIFGDPEPAGQ